MSVLSDLLVDFQSMATCTSKCMFVAQSPSDRHQPANC